MSFSRTPGMIAYDLRLSIPSLIHPGFVHLRSSVVEKVLLRAHAEGKRFSVIVIDSRPMLEGKANLLQDIRDFIFIFVRSRQALVETLDISSSLLLPAHHNVLHLCPPSCTSVFNK